MVFAYSLQQMALRVGILSKNQKYLKAAIFETNPFLKLEPVYYNFTIDSTAETFGVLYLNCVSCQINQIYLLTTYHAFQSVTYFFYILICWHISNDIIKLNRFN